MNSSKPRTCVVCNKVKTRSETNICPSCRGECDGNSSAENIESLAEFFTYAERHEIEYNLTTYQEWKARNGRSDSVVHTVPGLDRRGDQGLSVQDLLGEGDDETEDDGESLQPSSWSVRTESTRDYVQKVQDSGGRHRKNTGEVQRTIFDVIKEDLASKWRDSQAKTRLHYWQDVVLICDYCECRKGQIGTIVGRNQSGLVTKCSVFFGESYRGNMIVHDIPESILKEHRETVVNRIAKRVYRKRQRNQSPTLFESII